MKPPPEKPQAAATQILLIPPPEKTTARAMRPLWRDLIKAVWAVDPLRCPHCHGALRPVETLTRPEAIEFFLRLHGPWEGLVNIPRDFAQGLKRWRSAHVIGTPCRCFGFRQAERAGEGSGAFGVLGFS